MDTFLADIDQFYGKAPVPSDETGDLARVAELFGAHPPLVLFLASAGGGVLCAEDFASKIGPTMAPEAAVEVGKRLRMENPCVVERELGGQLCKAFGVRLSLGPEGDFLGAVFASQRGLEDELEPLAAALRVSGGLALLGMRREKAAKTQATQLQHLLNEQDTLKVSHSDAIVRALEERECRLQEEHDRLVAEQMSAANEASNRAKSQFLANMSHEIRTPLTAILGFTELLRGGACEGDPAERDEYLATIHSSATHLLELINDILDLSKIEAGRMDIERIPCSLQDVVAEVLSLMRVRAREKRIRLTAEWPHGMPSTIHTDPLRLKQLLMNLLGNAVKFTHHGEVRLVCRLLFAREQPQVAFDVIDTGIGIAPEKLAAIFDAFVQADNSVTREFGGTGLGLAISRRIARALGGDIAVQSVAGQGSTFTATIDAGAMDGVKILLAPRADAVAGGHAEGPSRSINLAAARVLLVEDGAVNRKLISLILRKAGAEVATAENGRLGADLARREDFDVILMDMQMPVMDGYAATRELRELGLTTPIIALTAHALSEDRQKCLLAGCSAHVSKPVKSQDLLQAIVDAMASAACPVSGPGGEARGDIVPATSSSAGGPLVSTLPLDDPDFREIVEDFIGYLGGQLEAMRKAAAEGDFSALTTLAHALKGTAGGAGFDALTQPVKGLEDAARAGNSNSVSSALRTLEQLVARIAVPTGEAAS